MLLALLTLGLLWWSWGKWPDVLVDVGRELYVPWQLASGKVLYRDIAYFNGPFSPYLNSLWFRGFGVSLRSLALANVAVLALLLALLYALLARVGGRVSALLACATFLLVFAFGQQIPIGNYNYITPYSHEITHGLVLALAAAFFLDRFGRGGRLADVGACGLCVGAALLTKPEILLATLAAISLGLALTLWTRRAPGVRAGACVGVYLAAVLVPPLLSVALLALALPLREAAMGTVGATRWLLTPALRSLRFYRSTMGLLDPAAALRGMLVWTAGYALLIGGVALLGRAWPKTLAPRTGAAAVFVVVVGTLVLCGIHWAQVLRPLPLFMLVATCAFVVAALRQSEPRERARLVLAATLSLLSLLLLAKVLLRARAGHYGFVLAMPATLVLVVVLWDWLPRLIAGSESGRAMMRAALLGALVVAAGSHVAITARFLAGKTVRVASGGDALWADVRGLEVDRMLREISAHVPAGASLAVVPEGVMLNYLARRPTSTRDISFMPVEMIMFGEDRMLAALAQHPPDFILLVARPLREYGFAGFGLDYAVPMAAWIGSHYHPLAGVPASPAMVLMRRNDGRRGRDRARGRRRAE